jgi:hypothetical protein
VIRPPKMYHRTNLAVEADWRCEDHKFNYLVSFLYKNISATIAIPVIRKFHQK